MAITVYFTITLRYFNKSTKKDAKDTKYLPLHELNCRCYINFTADEYYKLYGLCLQQGLKTGFPTEFIVYGHHSIKVLTSNIVIEDPWLTSIVTDFSRYIPVQTEIPEPGYKYLDLPLSVIKLPGLKVTSIKGALMNYKENKRLVGGIYLLYYKGVYFGHITLYWPEKLHLRSSNKPSCPTLKDLVDQHFQKLNQSN